MEKSKRFIGLRNGSPNLGVILILPLLLWTIGATAVFWDVFYARSLNNRAAYTIADTLSRETGDVNETYMDGIENVLSFLMKGQHETRIRVTAAAFDPVKGGFEVQWSYISDDNWVAHTTTSLASYNEDIAPPAEGNVAIIVETELAYLPFIEIGIKPTTMSEFIVTRPRFGSQLAWNETDGVLVTASEGNGDAAVSPLDPVAATGEF